MLTMPMLARPFIALLLAAAGVAGAQTPALRIVVIEGEDAVNIIQQKTAVAPLIEVRDRNNLPVPGVAVTFTVGGQSASFGGVSTLTVTTNAAGQAAAVGLTPTTAGAVQINAAAVFQGQTAVATITQTNVLTAAQAAGAAGATGGASGGAGGSGGASAGSAAAGGGGGMSATTIGLVSAAAVGGGALAATQLGGGEPQLREFAGSFSADMVLPFTGCTRTERRAGLLTIELQDTGDGPVNGTAGIEGGSVTILSNVGNQCSPNFGPQPGQGTAARPARRRDRVGLARQPHVFPHRNPARQRWLHWRSDVFLHGLEEGRHDHGDVRAHGDRAKRDSRPGKRQHHCYGDADAALMGSEGWCRRADSNCRPRAYETRALTG